MVVADVLRTPGADARRIFFADAAVKWHGLLFFLSGLARGLHEWGAIQAVERLNLDGLLALWHPAGTN